MPKTKPTAHLGISELTQVGAALYGPKWQTDLARALELSDARRVRQWLTGERKIPAELWPQAAVLLQQRIAEARQVLSALSARGAE